MYWKIPLEYYAIKISVYRFLFLKYLIQGFGEVLISKPFLFDMVSIPDYAKLMITVELYTGSK